MKLYPDAVAALGDVDPDDAFFLDPEGRLIVDDRVHSFGGDVWNPETGDWEMSDEPTEDEDELPEDE